MAYPAMYALTEAATLKGLQHRDRSGYLEALDGEVLRIVVEHLRVSSSPFAMVQMRVFGGAMARVPEEATAFPHRDKRFQVNIINARQDPADAEREHAWTNAFWTDWQPFTSGAYVNFLADEGEARIRAAYKPATYERLVAVKDRSDLTNFYYLNQNIRPDSEVRAEQWNHTASARTRFGRTPASGMLRNAAARTYFGKSWSDIGPNEEFQRFAPPSSTKGESGGDALLDLPASHNAEAFWVPLPNPLPPGRGLGRGTTPEQTELLRIVDGLARWAT
ncbi:MAG: BBE domain-containing protein [Dehalococcoidia bacterium]